MAIKIAMTVRNRLSITKKAIEALHKNTKSDFQLYIYDNLSNYKVREHWEYFWNLYSNNLVSQVTFNSKESTFNAFSKAVALNSFGLNHNQDPNKKKYDFLTFIDNDIIVTPNWDLIIKGAWQDIKENNIKNIYVISQLPGGIKFKKNVPNKIAGCEAKIGKLGGSAFWNVKTNFFDEIGFLNMKKLVGLNKKHDQFYWQKLHEASNGHEYILGINKKLCVHVGGLAGSVCNILSAGGNEKERLKKSKLEQQERIIESMSYDEFYDKVINDKKYIDGW